MGRPGAALPAERCAVRFGRPRRSRRRVRQVKGASAGDPLEPGEAVVVARETCAIEPCAPAVCGFQREGKLASLPREEALPRRRVPTARQGCFGHEPGREKPASKLYRQFVAARLRLRELAVL